MNLAPKTASRSAPKTLQVAAAVIGNALEWYDFIIFGFLTVVISRLFFPSDTQYASLLLTTATFGVGFFMRPVGGVLLGIYADRKGRKAALTLIIALMTAAIAMVAFAPTYAAIGVAAPITMVLARLLQGLATGGEFASATSFLIESAPADRRGFYGSWQMVGQGMALLLGALVSSAVTRGLSTEALDGWGWRIPFLLGLIIGPVGLYIRRHLDETDAFIEASAVPKQEQRPRIHSCIAFGRSDGERRHRRGRNHPVLCNSAVHAHLRHHAARLVAERSLRRSVDRPRISDLGDAAVWRAVGPHRTQADHDRRVPLVSEPRLPVVCMDVSEPLHQSASQSCRSCFAAYMAPSVGHSPRPSPSNSRRAFVRPPSGSLITLR